MKIHLAINQSQKEERNNLRVVFGKYFVVEEIEYEFKIKLKLKYLFYNDFSMSSMLKHI